MRKKKKKKIKFTKFSDHLKIKLRDPDFKKGFKKEKKKLHRLINDKLAGWMFHSLYWFDMYKLPRANWKDTLRKKYIESGMSKQYKKGTFKKTWKYIKKEDLIREGRKKKMKRIKKDKEEG